MFGYACFYGWQTDSLVDRFSLETSLEKRSSAHQPKSNARQNRYVGRLSGPHFLSLSPGLFGNKTDHGQHVQTKLGVLCCDRYRGNPLECDLCIVFSKRELAYLLHLPFDGDGHGRLRSAHQVVSISQNGNRCDDRVAGHVCRMGYHNCDGCRLTAYEMLAFSMRFLVPPETAGSPHNVARTQSEPFRR